MFQFVNTGPVAIPSGEKDTIAFAILATTQTNQEATLEEAKKAWECELLDQGPNELFSVSDGSPMEGEAVQFQDLNSGQLTWMWEFGDGMTSSLQNPQHIYANPGVYLARLTVSDGYCTQDHAREIQVVMSTSLVDAIPVRLVLYPNPSKGEFTLVTPFSGDINLEISDMAGRTIFRQANASIAGEEMKIQTDLAPGIYHLGVQSEAGSWNEILLIQD